MFLQRLWKTIQTKAKSATVPTLVYEEAELPLRIVRDLFAGDFVGAQIDDEKWMGVLFGLGGHASITGAASYQVPPSSGSVEPANGKP